MIKEINELKTENSDLKSENIALKKENELLQKQTSIPSKIKEDDNSSFVIKNKLKIQKS